MGLDVSDAIALAKDLLKTSTDYRPHDPDLADAFSERAFEICNDLGIDRSLIAPPQEIVEPVDIAPATTVNVANLDNAEDDDVIRSYEPSARSADDDDLEETSLQLRNLLQQQARVMQAMQEPEPVVSQKPRRSSFRLFGRSAAHGFGELQSA